MDDITGKLQAAADDLKSCFENVLHEDDLHQRAKSMTETQYESLRSLVLGGKGSAILHWLQLSWNSENPSLGGINLGFFFQTRYSRPLL